MIYVLRKLTVIFCLLGLTAMFSFVHPYHVAVTTIQYPTKGSQINIEIKVFYHDLEPAINKYGSVDIDVKNHDKKEFRDSLVYAYVNSHFLINYNEAKMSLDKAGIVFKDEYAFIRFTAEKKSITETSTCKIRIENSICYEVEKTQTNLFHVIYGDKKQSRKIVNPETFVVMEF